MTKIRVQVDESGIVILRGWFRDGKVPVLRSQVVVPDVGTTVVTAVEMGKGVAEMLRPFNTPPPSASEPEVAP